MSLMTHMGGNVYCGVPEYDTYTAYKSHTYETTWRDRHGNLWRSIRTVTNLGRPADVTPLDGEEALEREKLPPTANGTSHSTAWHDARRAQRNAELIALLKDRGPLRLRDAATLLNCHPRTIRDLMGVHDDVVSLGVHSGAPWIGLPGQVLPDRTHAPLAKFPKKVFEHLYTHGPTSATDIAAALGTTFDRTRETLRHRADVFVILRQERRGAFKHRTDIWGIVGIHDKGGE